MWVEPKSEFTIIFFKVMRSPLGHCGEVWPNPSHFDMRPVPTNEIQKGREKLDGNVNNSIISSKVADFARLSIITSFYKITGAILCINIPYRETGKRILKQLIQYWKRFACKLLSASIKKIIQNILQWR